MNPNSFYGVYSSTPMKVIIMFRMKKPTITSNNHNTKKMLNSLTIEEIALNRGPTCKDIRSIANNLIQHKTSTVVYISYSEIPLEYGS